MLAIATKQVALRVITLGVCAAILGAGLSERAVPAFAASPDFAALMAAPDRSGRDHNLRHTFPPTSILTSTFFWAL